MLNSYSFIHSFSYSFEIPKNYIDEIRSQKTYRLLDQIILFLVFAFLWGYFLILKNNVSILDYPRMFNDTYGYVDTSSYSLNNMGFWAGFRPFTIPLFYKMVGYNLVNYRDQGMMNRVGEIQTALSVIAWTIFAFCVSLAFKDKLVKIFSFAIVLFLAASIDITAWDKAMLTESLSTSLFVLFLAGMVVAGLIWDKKKMLPKWEQILVVAVIILVSIFFSFSRDTNSYLLLFIVGLMAIGMVFTFIRKHPLFGSYVALLIGLGTIFTLQAISANIGKRYESPLIHVIIDRVFPSQIFLNYFLQDGMPLNEKIALLKSNDRQLGSVHNSANQPPMDLSVRPFVQWIDTDGKMVTGKFLLTHPRFLFTAPFQDFWQMVNGEYSDYRKIASLPNAQTDLFTAIFYPRSNWWPYLSAALFIINLIAIWKSKDGKAFWLLNAILFLSTYPLGLFIWHSDTFELERHAYPIALQLRLASWISIIFLAGVCRSLFKKGNVL